MARTANPVLQAPLAHGLQSKPRLPQSGPDHRKPPMPTLPNATALALLLAFAFGASAAEPDPAKTLAYIDQGWTTLTRSMDDCSSLHDDKVKTRPVLYLPADLKRTAAIDAIAKRCKVDVRVLPQTVRQIGELDP